MTCDVERLKGFSKSETLGGEWRLATGVMSGLVAPLYHRGTWSQTSTPTLSFDRLRHPTPQLIKLTKLPKLIKLTKLTKLTRSLTCLT